MILIFDLDDTLYDEQTYVLSGLDAVAQYGNEVFGWSKEDSLSYMRKRLVTNGRGRIFDDWLKEFGKYSETQVQKCVKVYRHHSPAIKLFPEAKLILQKYRHKYPLYLVTDGHKIVQQKKVEALQLDPVFKRVFITHRFGIQNAKPSLHCFDIIRKTERCEWSDMVYVGDNPAKDFVNLNQVGAGTVRVATGGHASVKALPGYDAKFTVGSLSDLADLFS